MQMDSEAKPEKSLKIHVKPKISLVDEVVAIKLTGLKAFSEVTLRLSMQDDLMREWWSEAQFIADNKGIVDLQENAPANRVYAKGEHMCMFASMDLDMTSAMKGPPVLVRDIQRPMEVNLTAVSENGDRAMAHIVRKFLAPGVDKKHINEDKLIAAYFKPEGAGPFPAAVVVGGPIGGQIWSERLAGALASRGFATLSLLYFGVAHLPPELVEVPIEYFDAAISWLKKRSEVDANRIALIGSSKGAEAALLTAIYGQGVSAVVSYMPSSVVFQGIQVDGPVLSAKSSWLIGGNQLPFVPCYQEGSQITINTLSRLIELHSANLDSPYIVKKAEIEADRLLVPLLMFSGQSDKFWPSTRMAESIERKRDDAGIGLITEHVSYPGTGHGIGVPYLPQQSFGGGTSAANCAAEADAWQKMLSFLNEHLK